MGMQCHFSFSDLPELAIVKECIDDESGENVGYLITYNHQDIAVNGSEGSYWFDVGSTTQRQMSKIQLLIQWRVCFSCS